MSNSCGLNVSGVIPLSVNWGVKGLWTALATVDKNPAGEFYRGLLLRHSQIEG
ncbi:hypothetical protein QW180_02205 [Vibrio sinaloensis]|nr:hypothetical protein [Vibrio sinaloensis]